MRQRILVTIVAVASFAVIALFVPAALSVRGHIERGELLALQREASIVARRVPPSGPIDVAGLRAGTDGDHALAIYDRSMHLVDGNGPAGGDPIVAHAVDGIVDEGYVAGDLVAALPIRFDADGPEYILRVTEAASESQHRVRRDLGMLAVAAVTIIAAAAFAGVLLARRLSRPLEDLREWAGTFGQTHTPPPPPSGITEVDTLGAALAGADGRIRQLLERERSFSSHVAHQLKTPVAAMRVAVEAELDHPRGDPREVLEESLGALDRLESTIASMLALAHDRERQLVLCDITSVVTSRVEHWQAHYAGAGRTAQSRGAPVWALVDVSAIDHILDVLLDNALTHGAGRVVVSAHAARETIDIDVIDEGCAATGSDPFGEQRSDSGHGIGLRLARTLAELAGGDLVLASATPTVFRLTFPLRR